ncbi:MarR family transcriptional regulator [Mycolicibacterium flavescens]|uniref:MarR family transcriptional regulator n=1 Tax=Mycolicibacterium flavescens TaxID=1776 RepID=A0A1E3RGX4_MYCFV|nr:MarR family transcriptional regulator [Mycolicibacterium flavescens]MCV7279251.1 MarR family transcriptional regulator [Mycolicibacterium flavescens]ODQ89104.1 MarR family transcriptional regulator [Mycolicibacterium flavescens]
MSVVVDPRDVEAISEMIVTSADLLWRHLVDRADLSASATLVLNRLDRQGPMRLTALAEAEGASQSGMTQLVQRLEQQGLLERCSDPRDGRARLVAISEAGRKQWDIRAGIRRQRIAELIAPLPSADQVALALAAQVGARLLAQMRDAADGATAAPGSAAASR